MTPTLVDAIQSLAPSAQFSISGDSLAGLQWQSTDVARPTDAEIEAELVRLIAEWDAAEYKRKRAEEYPALDALLVALWESTVEGRPATADELQAIREAVKAKYPKPQG